MVTDSSVLYATDWSAELTNAQKAKARDAIGAADASIAGNPFTTEEKQKLRSIQAGAEQNVQSDWTMADSTDDRYIQHKPAMILLTPDDYIVLTEPSGGGELNIGLNVSTGDYDVG